MRLMRHYKEEKYVQEGNPRKKREKGAKSSLAKIMAPNFPNLRRKRDMKIQEAQGIPIRRNSKRITLRYIVKLSKFIEAIHHVQVNFFILSVDLSAKTYQARREWDDIL